MLLAYSSLLIVATPENTLKKCTENIAEMDVFYMVYQDSNSEAEYAYISMFVYGL